jgi:hypothetical protein
MDDSLSALVEEISVIISEGLSSSELQAGQNAVVLAGPITVVSPTPNEYDA